MSRITYKASVTPNDVNALPAGEGITVTVVTGWDRPLQYHHLTMFDEAGEVWYDGLDSATAFQTTALEVTNKLRELGVAMPTTLGALLEDHEYRDAGNEALWLPDCA